LYRSKIIDCRNVFLPHDAYAHSTLLQIIVKPIPQHSNSPQLQHKNINFQFTTTILLTSLQPASTCRSILHKDVNEQLRIVYFTETTQFTDQ